MTQLKDQNISPETNPEEMEAYELPDRIKNNHLKDAQ